MNYREPQSKMAKFCCIVIGCVLMHALVTAGGTATTFASPSAQARLRLPIWRNG